MNFFVSIICAMNLYLLSAMPIAQLSVRCDPLTPPGCKQIPAPEKIPQVSTNSTNSVLLQFRKNPLAFVSAMSKADPDTLREILVLLHTLLDTSKTRETELIDFLNDKIAELDTAEDDVTNAEGVLDSANNQEAVAEHALTSAQESVASAESDLANKRDVVSTKQTEKNDAQANHDATIDTLNGEQTTLEQVIEILEDLLGRQDLILEHNGLRYYRIPVSGTMTSSNILDACTTKGLTPLCSGPNGCTYNDANCKITDLSVNCNWPMGGVSQIICNENYPSNCEHSELQGLYNYMANWHSPPTGCGVNNGNWCVNGGAYSDKDALCVS